MLFPTLLWIGYRIPHFPSAGKSFPAFLDVYKRQTNVLCFFAASFPHLPFSCFLISNQTRQRILFLIWSKFNQKWTVKNTKFLILTAWFLSLIHICWSRRSCHDRARSARFLPTDPSDRPMRHPWSFPAPVRPSHWQSRSIPAGHDRHNLPSPS